MHPELGITAREHPNRLPIASALLGFALIAAGTIETFWTAPAARNAILKTVPECSDNDLSSLSYRTLQNNADSLWHSDIPLRQLNEKYGAEIECARSATLAIDREELGPGGKRTSVDIGAILAGLAALGVSLRAVHRRLIL